MRHFTIKSLKDIMRMATEDAPLTVGQLMDVSDDVLYEQAARAENTNKIATKITMSARLHKTESNGIVLIVLVSYSLCNYGIRCTLRHDYVCRLSDYAEAGGDAIGLIEMASNSTRTCVGLGDRIARPLSDGDDAIDVEDGTFVLTRFEHIPLTLDRISFLRKGHAPIWVHRKLPFAGTGDRHWTTIIMNKLENYLSNSEIDNVRNLIEGPVIYTN